MDKNLLKSMLCGRIVIACVGNELRGDDGVGPFISRLIKPTSEVSIINCAETPENYLGVIAGLRPQKVVIIDAAQFGGTPGEVRIVKKDEIVGAGLSTHDAILTLFADFIENETAAETYFIAIQPGSSGIGERLSVRVEEAAREVADAINRAIAGGSEHL